MSEVNKMEWGRKMFSLIVVVKAMIDQPHQIFMKMHGRDSIADGYRYNDAMNPLLKIFFLRHENETSEFIKQKREG